MLVLKICMMGRISNEQKNKDSVIHEDEEWAFRDGDWRYLLRTNYVARRKGVDREVLWEVNDKKSLKRMASRKLETIDITFTNISYDVKRVVGIHIQIIVVCGQGPR